MRPGTPRTLVALLLAMAASAPTTARSTEVCGTHADERALAAVTARVDTACPCRRFRQRGRAAYRRCARRVVRAAVADGSLRAECRSTAVEAARASTCGSCTRPDGAERRGGARDDPALGGAVLERYVRDVSGLEPFFLPEAPPPGVQLLAAME